MSNYPYNPFLSSLQHPVSKSRVFVSYHHGADQAYYDAFARHFSATYDVFTDRSLRNPINSDNTDYVMRRIREDYITGSSCTIVLCGRETRRRKYVDWEIKATLDKEHGVIGVLLPTNPFENNAWHKPDRLQDNIDSGYVVWTSWSELTGSSTTLSSLIKTAKNRSSRLINNQRPLMSRNGRPPWRF